MPRTKRPTKKDKKSIDGGEKAEILKKFDKLVEDQKKKIDDLVLMEVRNIELAFKILMGSISEKYLNMTVGELKNMLHINETISITRSDSHDDGYITENSSHGSGERGGFKRMAPPSSTSRPTTASSRSTTASRRSRSADASSRKLAPPSASRTLQRRRSRSVYRTPTLNKNAHLLYPPITPKVAPETPLTVLRQPRAGEMVVSMTGSPVMVPTFSSMQAEQKANCNIMLTDGTMLSLQPRELRQSTAYIPFSLLDPGVLEQIKTLKDNLEKVVKLGEKANK